MMKVSCMFLGCKWKPVELRQLSLGEIDPATPSAPRTRKGTYIVGIKECARCKRRQMVTIVGRK